MLEVESRKLVNHRYFRVVMLVALLFLVLQLSAVLQNASEHRKILCLIGKDLYMLMSLRGSCLRSTVIKIKALNCPKGQDDLPEIFLIDEVGLWLKFLSNNKQMILVEVKLIEEQSMPHS